MNTLRNTLLVIACSILITNNLNSQNWDINTLKNINPEFPTSPVWKGFSNSMYVVSVGTPAAMLIKGYLKGDKKLQSEGWSVVAYTGVTTAITMSMKYAINRERPFVTYPNDIHPGETPQDPSFPSGHASIAFTTATSLSLLYPKWYVIAPSYLWASGVAYSRMYLGVHYPTDVIVGAALGAGSTLLCHWLNKKFFILKPINN